MSVIGAQIRGVEYLSFANEGEYIIEHVPSGSRARHRCYSMGLIPGSEIIVKHNNNLIPIIVNSRGAEYAIGRGLAFKIMVKHKN